MLLLFYIKFYYTVINMLKKLSLFFTTACLILSTCAFGLTASAAVVKAGTITIDTVSAVPGDEVLIPINISENPGIMAVTVSITYDSDALEYVRYYRGSILKDYTVVNHTDKSVVRFVNCESKDRLGDGLILSIKFRVKENAEVGMHKVDIKYSAGDFCNWKLDKLMPEVISGGVDVDFNGNNCSHKKYGEWTVAAEASCEESGAEQRTCQTCGHVEQRDTDPVGHEYSENWTVDQPATAEQDGIMTRYCIRCDDYVDRITFSLEQAEEGNIKNEINADTPVNDFTENLFKEQYPDKELTNSKPAKEKNSSSSSQTDSSQGEATYSQNESSTDEEKESNSVYQILDGIIPDVKNTDGEDISFIDKIAEVFPNFETLTNVLEIALIILTVLVL